MFGLSTIKLMNKRAAAQMTTEAALKLGRKKKKKTTSGSVGSMFNPNTVWGRSGCPTWSRREHRLSFREHEVEFKKELKT
jgi:hypothetical protein